MGKIAELNIKLISNITELLEAGFFENEIDEHIQDMLTEDEYQFYLANKDYLFKEAKENQDFDDKWIDPAGGTHQGDYSYERDEEGRLDWPGAAYESVNNSAGEEEYDEESAYYDHLIDYGEFSGGKEIEEDEPKPIRVFRSSRMKAYDSEDVSPEDIKGVGQTLTKRDSTDEYYVTRVFLKNGEKGFAWPDTLRENGVDPKTDKVNRFDESLKKHQAPHIDKNKSLDVEDRKSIKSYNSTRLRKIRKFKNVDEYGGPQFSQSGMHGENDFFEAVLNSVSEKYKDIIENEDWGALLDAVRKDWPSLTDEAHDEIVGWFKDDEGLNETLVRGENQQERFIDLRGPSGNAYVILGMAHSLCKQLEKVNPEEYNWEKINSEMTSSDYKNLVQTFEKYFGEYVTIYNADVIDESFVPTYDHDWNRVHEYVGKLVKDKTIVTEIDLNNVIDELISSKEYNLSDDDIEDAAWAAYTDLEFKDYYRTSENGIDESIVMPKLNEGPEDESEAHPSDDLKANFRSWERDHDNEEDAESLFQILVNRHPYYPKEDLKNLAYNWVGYVDTDKWYNDVFEYLVTDFQMEEDEAETFMDIVSDELEELLEKGETAFNASSIVFNNQNAHHELDALRYDYDDDDEIDESYVMDPLNEAKKKRKKKKTKKSKKHVTQIPNFYFPYLFPRPPFYPGHHHHMPPPPPPPPGTPPPPMPVPESVNEGCNCNKKKRLAKSIIRRPSNFVKLPKPLPKKLHEEKDYHLTEYLTDVLEEIGRNFDKSSKTLFGWQNEGGTYIIYKTIKGMLDGYNAQDAFVAACDAENYHGNREDIVEDRSKIAKVLYDHFGINVNPIFESQDSEYTMKPLNEVDYAHMAQLNRETDRTPRYVGGYTQQHNLKEPIKTVPKFNYPERTQGIKHIAKQHEILKDLGYDLETGEEDPTKVPTKRELKKSKNPLNDKFNQLKGQYWQEERELQRLHRKHEKGITESDKGLGEIGTPEHYEEWFDKNNRPGLYRDEENLMAYKKRYNVSIEDIKEIKDYIS